MTAQQVIQLLKNKQGAMTQAAFAKRVGVSAAYLSDIYLGKRDPGKNVLKFLGLKRETIYQ